MGRVESLGFRTDLGLRRLGGSSILIRDQYLVVKTRANPGFWWGNFVLLSRPVRTGAAEQLRAIFLEEFPDSPYLAFGVDGTRGEIGDSAEVAALGMTADVSAVLRAERLREPARVNRHAVFRQLTDDDDWEQAMLLRLAVYDVPDTDDDRLFVQRQFSEARQICDRGLGSWFGAFLEDRLVAALGILGLESGIARYQSVETLPGQRRQGFASRLLYESSLYGREVLGARTLVIVADPDYHALGMYRSLGFTISEQQVQLQSETNSGLDHLD